LTDSSEDNDLLKETSIFAQEGYIAQALLQWPDVALN